MNEEWTPKTGDEIEVRVNATSQWIKRTYAFSYKRKFYCVCRGDNASFLAGNDFGVFPFVWAQEIPKKKHRPYTMKEFTAEWVKRGMPDIYGDEVFMINEEMIQLKPCRIVSYSLMLSRSKSNMSFWSNGDIMGVEVVE